MHAARWVAAAPAGERNSGSIRLQSSIAIGHRGWKRHPDGIRTASGVSPRRIYGSRRLRGSRLGTTDRSARV
jgi:hypothetical protein